MAMIYRWRDAASSQSLSSHKPHSSRSSACCPCSAPPYLITPPRPSPRKQINVGACHTQLQDSAGKTGCRKLLVPNPRRRQPGATDRQHNSRCYRPEYPDPGFLRGSTKKYIHHPSAPATGHVTQHNVCQCILHNTQLPSVDAQRARRPHSAQPTTLPPTLLFSSGNCSQIST